MAQFVDDKDEEVELVSLLVNPPDNTLLCVICYDIIKNAVYLPCCGHSICDQCLIAQKNICPFDKKQVDNAGPNIQLRNFVNSLKIRCRFACGEDFAVSDRLAHEKQCECVVENCPNNCETVFFRKDRNSHMLVCSFAQGNIQNEPSEQEAIQHLLEKYGRNAYDNCVEFFNLNPPVTDQLIQDMVEVACGSEILQEFQFAWTANKSNWVLLRCNNEQISKKIHQGLLDLGFPFVRFPIDETTNEPFNGKTSHLSFCPPLHKMDCPVFEEKHIQTPMYCPFRHKQTKSECKKWTLGYVCNHPNCIFEHKGKIVTDLKFTAKIPNICKYCQSGRHFGWECPAAQKQKAVKAVEKIIKKNGGEILLSQLGAIARQESEHFVPVMQRHYHNKLRKFLEDFSGKFLLLDLEKPGSAKVRMLGVPQARIEGSPIQSYSNQSPYQSIFKTTVGGMVSNLPSSLGNEWDWGTKMGFKNRNWSSNEIQHLIMGEIKPYFENILAEGKAHHLILQHISKFDEYHEAFSGAISIKMFIQDLSTVISNIRVQQYNPTLSSQVPTVTIEQLKHYEDPIYKSIKKIYQICGSDPSKYSILSEGDSLAAVFYHIKTSLDYLLKPSRPQVSETANRFGRMSLHRSGVVPEVPNMESAVKSDVVCINCGRVGHQSVSCNRCSNCTRMHGTSQCSQTFPSCGFCHTTKRSNPTGHKTSECVYLKEHLNEQKLSNLSMKKERMIGNIPISVSLSPSFGSKVLYNSPLETENSKKGSLASIFNSITPATATSTSMLGSGTFPSFPSIQLNNNSMSPSQRSYGSFNPYMPSALPFLNNGSSKSPPTNSKDKDNKHSIF